MQDVATSVQTSLHAIGAEFEVIAIDPDLADTAAFCDEYGYSPDASANAIVIASKRPVGVFSLCVALATTRLDVNHRVKHEMGVKKLSFASPETTAEMTGMMIGGVTPFATPQALPILVDGEVCRRSKVIVGGGDRSTKILVDPEVFTRMPNVRVVDNLASRATDG